MMLFKQVLIEHQCLNDPKIKDILARLPADIETLTINSIDDYFGRYERPYLQKRTDLKLYLGYKRGTLVRPAPPAYAGQTGDHYYFIHAYNCIYECHYCYLQGYFNSPDIVLFLNHQEILDEMEKICFSNPQKTIWFHAGEFSDSLALNWLTEEWDQYFSRLKNWPNAHLELRTKSVNIVQLLKLNPIPQICVSYTLSPSTSAKEFDAKTPSLKARLNAIQKLVAHGHPIGIHFDPIILGEQNPNEYLAEFEQMARELQAILPESSLEYISLGVVRFTKKVYQQMEKNYPHSSLLGETLVKSFDQKYRYARPLRNWLFTHVEEILKRCGYPQEKIYRSMENEDKIGRQPGVSQ